MEVCNIGTQALSVPPPISSQLVSGIICMSLAAKLMLDRAFNGRPVETLFWLEICQRLQGLSFQSESNFYWFLFG